MTLSVKQVIREATKAEAQAKKFTVMARALRELSSVMARGEVKETIDNFLLPRADDWEKVPSVVSHGAAKPSARKAVKAKVVLRVAKAKKRKYTKKSKWWGKKKK